MASPQPNTHAQPVIDVAFTRAGARRADVTVVIDVLRATTTIVQALDVGYERVLAVDSVARARGLAGDGRRLAGEERCVRPDGFDFGNSPSEITRPEAAELVLATTNGAPSIVRAGELSETVLIGCLRNLDAVVATLAGRGDVQLLCAGTDGGPAVEDVYVAGRIALRLDLPRTDGALIACAVAERFAQAREALTAGANAAVLVREGLEPDIDWCAAESVVDDVPRLAAQVPGVATIIGSAVLSEA